MSTLDAFFHVTDRTSLLSRLQIHSVFLVLFTLEFPAGFVFKFYCFSWPIPSYSISESMDNIMKLYIVFTNSIKSIVKWE